MSTSNDKSGRFDTAALRHQADVKSCSSECECDWFDSRLSETLDEIDRLEKKCQREYGRGVEQGTDDETRQVIERQTKEACFKAGWDWIQANTLPKSAARAGLNLYRDDFKQAIDEVEVT